MGDGRFGQFRDGFGDGPLQPVLFGRAADLFADAVDLVGQLRHGGFDCGEGGFRLPQVFRLFGAAARQTAERGAGVRDAAGQTAQLFADRFGGLCRFFGQFPHFVRDDGEAGVLGPGASRLDRGVEREQMGLRRNAGDGGDDFADVGGIRDQSLQILRQGCQRFIGSRGRKFQIGDRRSASDGSARGFFTEAAHLFRAVQQAFRLFRRPFRLFETAFGFHCLPFGAGCDFADRPDDFFMSFRRRIRKAVERCSVFRQRRRDAVNARQQVGQPAGHPVELTGKLPELVVRVDVGMVGEVAVGDPGGRQHQGTDRSHERADEPTGCDGGNERGQKRYRPGDEDGVPQGVRRPVLGAAGAFGVRSGEFLGQFEQHIPVRSCQRVRLPHQETGLFRIGEGLNLMDGPFEQSDEFFRRNA